MARPGRPRKYDPVADDIERCIRNGEDATAKKLITAHEVDLPDGDARTPLIWASFYDCGSLLQWIIDRGGDVNHQDRNGQGALHFAAQKKLGDIAEILLRAGAETELRDVYGNTPLWTATFNARGDLSVVKLLATEGASFDNKNNAGKTVREMAEKFFPDELAKLLR
ncbi:MAG: ankyrin repeat domain-containing protein [Acidobacteriota bacterium]